MLSADPEDGADRVPPRCRSAGLRGCFTDEAADVIMVWATPCRRSCNSPPRSRNSPWGRRARRGGPGHRDGETLPPVEDGGPMAKRTFDVVDMTELPVHWH